MEVTNITEEPRADIHRAAHDFMNKRTDQGMHDDQHLSEASGLPPTPVDYHTGHGMEALTIIRPPGARGSEDETGTVLKRTRHEDAGRLPVSKRWRSAWGSALQFHKPASHAIDDEDHVVARYRQVHGPKHRRPPDT